MPSHDNQGQNMGQMGNGFMYQGPPIYQNQSSAGGMMGSGGNPGRNMIFAGQGMGLQQSGHGQQQWN